MRASATTASFVAPVAARELRESARRPANFRLRLTSGLGGIVLLYLTTKGAAGLVPGGSPIQAAGAMLFSRLHLMLMALICVFVPAMTADCIARERREGTLGLLFLTPLTARGVVIGKSLAQGMRALTLWLAVVPILTVPLVAGGVSWSHVISAMTIELITAMVCLASGLAVSGRATTRNEAMAGAYGLATLVLNALLMTWSFATWAAAPRGSIPGLEDLLRQGLGLALGTSPYSAATLLPSLSGPIMWSGTMGVGRITYSSGSATYTVIAQSGSAWAGLFTKGSHLGMQLSFGLFLALFWLYLAVAISAAAVNRSWKDQIASKRKENLVRRFCTPLFQRWFQKRMRRSMDRNPIAWLQTYSWKARASKWGFCAGILLADSALFGSFARNNSSIWTSSDNYLLLQDAVAAVLAGVFTYVGVSGFLAEKRNGALELLLVTPISVKRIILGRAWGLWMQFLPAAVALAVGNLAMITFTDASSVHWALGRGQFIPVGQEQIATLTIDAVVFIALPIFSTYAALRVKNLIGAAVLTWIGLGLCAFTAFVIGLGMNTAPMDELADLSILMVFSAVGYVALTFFLLHHSLSRRIYSF